MLTALLILVHPEISIIKIGPIMSSYIPFTPCANDPLEDKT